MSRRNQYEEFMKEGTLFVFDGTVLDMMQVYEDLDNFVQQNQYDVRAFGYDPYNAQEFVERWGQENGTFGITKVIQGARTESVPLGELKKLSEQRKLLLDEKTSRHSFSDAVCNGQLHCAGGHQRQPEALQAAAGPEDRCCGSYDGCLHCVETEPGCI